MEDLSFPPPSLTCTLQFRPLFLLHKYTLKNTVKSQVTGDVKCVKTMDQVTLRQVPLNFTFSTLFASLTLVIQGADRQVCNYLSVK